ncbi:hypothetical protein AA14_10250 [Salmonella enterica]|nr:hypothetical protein [Salmonella enterica]EBK1959561.1 hypothetical protein [Salmonella enterica subsp. enterica serovar Newport]ECC3463759.1 hypothetical protein [Salmonella enterica subsp. enterica]ECX6009259.1 hypothetical protein [Salmonella enterica subsp. enterica serovar Rubislaw]ECO0900792.1 hypothetical protein [Salmonella enterica subsp. enterica serovar Newport]
MVNELVDIASKFVPFMSLVVTIIGWNISSFLSGKNTFKNSKNMELNHLIDALYKILDDIYNEMIQLVTIEVDDHKKNVSYHKFIGMIQDVKFLSDTINKLDNTQVLNAGLFAELRQACTDDRKYSPAKIGIALPELRDIQERVKSAFNKKFD